MRQHQRHFVLRSPNKIEHIKYRTPTKLRTNKSNVWTQLSRLEDSLHQYAQIEHKCSKKPLQILLACNQHSKDDQTFCRHSIEYPTSKCINHPNTMVRYFSSLSCKKKRMIIWIKRYAPSCPQVHNHYYMLAYHVLHHHIVSKSYNHENSSDVYLGNLLQNDPFFCK